MSSRMCSGVTIWYRACVKAICERQAHFVVTEQTKCCAKSGYKIDRFRLIPRLSANKSLNAAIFLS